jgi:hypothetical protein
MTDNFGLNDNYEYLEFELDSLDATSSKVSSSSSTDWPIFTVAAKGPLEEIAAIKILEVQIPFSWYVFNSVNNTFILSENGYTSKTVTIPIGNYTTSSLITVLETALNSASSSSGSSNTWDVTYSDILQKYTFTASSTDFSFTFGAGYGIPGVQPNSGNRNPRLYIGFPAGVSSSTSRILISPNALLISGPNYIYVNSTALGSDVDVFLPEGAFNLGGGKAGPQISKIPVSCDPGGIIIWQDPDPQKWFKYDQLQSLNSFDFYLTLGNTTSQIPLQLNGLSFSLKLGILRQLKTNVDNVIPTFQNGRISRREGPKRPRYTF